MEAVDVESGCGRSIANHVVFDLSRHKAAKHHHSGPDHNAGHESELSDKAQLFEAAPQARHATDSLVATAQRSSSEGRSATLSGVILLPVGAIVVKFGSNDNDHLYK